MDALEHEHRLFGGPGGWMADDWVASDDRVRGGKSQSYFNIDADGATATFCGNLDIDTLGGAGFASQRTTGDDRCWDLSHHDGISLHVAAARSDAKSYTLILKDAVLPKDPETGREQATISWECDFSVPAKQATDAQSHHQSIFIPWTALEPTYRGKKRKPDHALKTHAIKRISVMMRSHFGAQQGTFVLSLYAIAAAKTPSHVDGMPEKLDPNLDSGDDDGTSPRQEPAWRTTGRGIIARLLPCCCRL